MQPDNTSSAGDTKIRFDYISRVHTYINDYIRFADTKAGLILAACGSLFIVPMTRADALSDLITGVGGFWKLILITAILLLVLALIYTAYHCMLCIYPTLTSPSTSKVFFCDIANTTVDDYQQTISSLRAEDAISELTEHCYWLSQVAVKKYLNVQQATCGLGTILVLCLIITSVLLSTGTQPPLSSNVSNSSSTGTTPTNSASTKKVN